MTEAKQKIQRLSRLLKVAFFIAACSLPILTAGYWVSNGYPFLKPWMYWNEMPEISMQGVYIKPIMEMDGGVKFLAFLVSLIPTSISVVALLFLAKLFRSYEQLEIFSKTSVQCLRKIGYCVVLNQLIHPFYYALMSLTVTFSNPPGQRMVAVAVGPEQVKFLVVGASILLISWVMEEGRKLQEEQEATV